MTGDRSDIVTPDTRRMLVITLCVSLGGLVFGYDAVVISGAIGMVEREFALTHWQVGWVVSAPTLSAIFASLAAGPLADRFGRRPVLLAVSVLYVISAILSSTANGFVSLSLARMAGGIAFSSLVVAPLFLAEIAPAKSRGGVVSMNQMAVVLGLSAAYFTNLAILHLSQSGAGWVAAIGMDVGAWRWMFAVELVPAVLWLGALLLAVPESPRWLVAQSRFDRARRILTRVRQASAADEALERIRASLGEETQERGSLSGLVSSPLIRTLLGIALIVAIAQQATGVNAIYFYAPTVFQQSGVGASLAFVQAAVMGVFNVIFTIVAVLTIDRLGRRPLLIVGLSGVLVSTAVAGWAFSQDGGANSYLILGAILLFVASFAVSLGPVTWVLMSEIFPNRYRGLAIAIVAFVNGTVSFLVQLVFPVQLQTLGAGPTFLIYSALAALFLVLVIRFVPETKGETLEGLAGRIAARTATRRRPPRPPRLADRDPPCRGPGPAKES